MPPAPSPHPPPLIVTADDFGFGLQTSRGILQAHLQGPVTSTSLMVLTEDHARASIQLLPQAPHLEVGLHLVLTHVGHKPLAATPSSGLLDRTGRLLPQPKLLLRSLLRRLNPQAITDEIAAQAHLFQRLMGKPPPYFDGHHHVHQYPVIRDAIASAIAHKILPPVTRSTIEPPALHRNLKSALLRRQVIHHLGRSARPKFTQHNAWTNDWFFGVLSPQDLNTPFPWAPQLALLPTTGTIEWMTHPGLPDDSLLGRDDYALARVQELNALTNPTLHPLWHPLRPSLTTRQKLLFK